MTKSTQPPRRLDLCDAALLAAFAVMAILGTWQRCLLVNDGAVYLAAAWLGNAWDLFYDQNTGRAVSTLLQFGPAWALRPVFGASSDAFMIAAHALYFAGPLVLWLILHLVEPQRIFSRLYLAVVLALVFFTSEMVQGIGLWMIWLALIADPARSQGAKIAATVAAAAILAFTHPAIALLSLAFGACGAVLILLRLPFPRHLAVASLTMGLFLTAAYFATAAMFLPTNPTIAAQHAGAKYDYINPVWMLGTLGFFPVLITLWLLLLAPGLEGAGLRWPYALALALALALASPVPAWFAAARRPLIIFAVVMGAATLSYTVDLALFAHAVEARLAPLEAHDTAPPRFLEIDRSPPPAVRTTARGYFKWITGDDYVRDVVVPDYGGGRMTFAFYTFFQSGRRVVVFRPLDRPGEWIPFECAPVDRALGAAYDDVDRRMLRFIRERYCVSRSGGQV